MDDGGFGVVGGHLLLEPGLDGFPARRIGGQCLVVAIAPAVDLALHVALGLAQVGQAALLVIDLVQLHQFVDEAFAQGFGARGVQVEFRRQVRAQDDALDPFHDIELGANDRFIGAVHIRLGAVGKTTVELVEDAVFAAHVMGRLGLVAKGWPAQHELLPRVLQQVGQVRGAARKLADHRLAFKAGNMRLEIGVDQAGIKLFAGANTGGLVSKRHAYPL
ncbi:hypothetical protein D3C84_400580 [compost metagenome]